MFGPGTSSPLASSQPTDMSPAKLPSDSRKSLSILYRLVLRYVQRTAALFDFIYLLIFTCKDRLNPRQEPRAACSKTGR